MNADSDQFKLSPEQRSTLFKGLVNDRVLLLTTSTGYAEQVVIEGIKGFNDHSDPELIKAAVDAELTFSLGMAFLDEHGIPLPADESLALVPNDEMFWKDPAEVDVLKNILEFHDISRIFWDGLLEHQKSELAFEAGEVWSGSSGIYQVVKVNTESGKVETRDSVLMLRNDAGSEAEVFAHELMEVPS